LTCQYFEKWVSGENFLVKVGLVWLVDFGRLDFPFSLFYFFHSNRVLIAEITPCIPPCLKRKKLTYKKKKPQVLTQSKFIYPVNKLVKKFSDLSAKKPAKFKARIPLPVLKIEPKTKAYSFLIG